MIYSRISARRGQKVALDSTFYRGGVRADPWAVYRIEIFRGKVEANSIVDAIDITPPYGSEYPDPLVRQPDIENTNLTCPSPPSCDSIQLHEGTEGPDSTTGRFRLVWDVPSDLHVPDVYFDVWYYFASDPFVDDDIGTGTEPDLSTKSNLLLNSCNRFWVYPDNWYVDGGLDTIRFGFEPLDIKYKKPESRPLEVGIMPLPLYDYNYNLVAPIIPFLDSRISIWTENNEQIVSNEKCQMKIRQGAFRSNPWVVSYILDTCRFFIGTYKYRIICILPDGSSRVSGDFFFTVS